VYNRGARRYFEDSNVPQGVSVSSRYVKNTETKVENARSIRHLRNDEKIVALDYENLNKYLHPEQEEQFHAQFGFVQQEMEF
jgi:predicted RNase H-related nuclease YkuK (DUF458 family)